MCGDFAPDHVGAPLVYPEHRRAAPVLCLEGPLLIVDHLRWFCRNHAAWDVTLISPTRVPSFEEHLPPALDPACPPARQY
jgi:hypothetical protein